MTRRILLLATAVTGLVVVAFLVPLLFLVRDVAAARAVAAATIEAQSAAALVGVDDEALMLTLDQLNAGNDRLTTVFLPDGQTLGAPAERDAWVRTAEAQHQAFTAEQDDGQAVLVPVGVGVDQWAVVRTFVPGAALTEGVDRATVALLLLGIGLLGLAVLVAFLLGRSLVRPLIGVAGTADTLRGGDLTARAEPDGTPEIHRIAEALNRLAARIEDLIQAERESVADLSHGLRTPLTALRLDAEALRDQDEAERLLADVDAVERMITHVITQARRPRERPAGSADLAAVVAERIAFWSALAEEQDRDVRTRLPAEPVPVPVPADSVVAMLDALLGNVFAHTGEGVGMSVEVAAAPVPTLVVADEGPGVADPALRERGRSGGSSTGLGLDIVRRTAEEAGGRMELQSARPHGLRVVVSLGRPPGH